MSDQAATTLRLPGPDGTVTHRVSARRDWHDRSAPPARSRTAYAAAHVVIDPLAEPADQATPVVDWEATMAFRHHLWRKGLGVADAMDTAQRGGGLDWPLAKELITRSGAEARATGGALVCGAMTDQLAAGESHSLERIVEAYVEQVEWIAAAGATPVLMASRQLAFSPAAPRTAEDYRKVYDSVLGQIDVPVMLHWLGEAFDPQLRGYWGSTDLDAATETVLELINDHPGRIIGIKMSLLDAGREVALRRRLPEGVRMFTGDDFHYDTLVLGDDQGSSDALLGVYDALAAPASFALAALDTGDVQTYREALEPTVPLARHMFTAPTSAYKTGVVFLAWLNGHQRHFHLLGGAQSARSVRHLTELFVRADEAGVLADPELAVRRMRHWLAVAGFEA